MKKDQGSSGSEISPTGVSSEGGEPLGARSILQLEAAKLKKEREHAATKDEDPGGHGGMGVGGGHEPYLFGRWRAMRNVAKKPLSRRFLNRTDRELSRHDQK